MMEFFCQINKFNFRNDKEALKEFLTRHDIPGEIVLDLNVSINAVTVQLTEGSAIKYGDKIDFAFNTLPSAEFNYRPMGVNDQILCWSKLLNDVIQSNKDYLHQNQTGVNSI